MDINLAINSQEILLASEISQAQIAAAKLKVPGCIARLLFSFPAKPGETILFTKNRDISFFNDKCEFFPSGLFEIKFKSATSCYFILKAGVPIRMTAQLFMGKDLLEASAMRFREAAIEMLGPPAEYSPNMSSADFLTRVRAFKTPTLTWEDRTHILVSELQSQSGRTLVHYRLR